MSYADNAHAIPSMPHFVLTIGIPLWSRLPGIPIHSPLGPHLLSTLRFARYFARLGSRPTAPKSSPHMTLAEAVWKTFLPKQVQQQWCRTAVGHFSVRLSTTLPETKLMNPLSRLCLLITVRRTLKFVGRSGPFTRTEIFRAWSSSVVDFPSGKNFFRKRVHLRANMESDEQSNEKH